MDGRWKKSETEGVFGLIEIVAIKDKPSGKELSWSTDIKKVIFILKKKKHTDEFFKLWGVTTGVCMTLLGSVSHHNKIKPRRHQSCVPLSRTLGVSSTKILTRGVLGWVSSSESSPTGSTRANWRRWIIKKTIKNICTFQKV